MPLAGANSVDVTIAINTSLSTAAAIGAGEVVGIVLPTITTASLTFQASADGTTFTEALDAASAAVTVASSAGARYIKAPADLAGVPYLKVRSGTSGSPVNQAAARTITLIIK